MSGRQKNSRFLWVFKSHSFSVRVTSEILRLHIKNFSSHLVPRKVTAAMLDWRKSE